MKSKPDDGSEDRGVSDSVAGYPPLLAEIVDLFEHLPEEEKRESLIAYADGAANCALKSGEAFDLEDTRKDEECTDTVGVFLRVDPKTRAAHFRINLGSQVQTLTRAMTTILCKGLDGATPEQVLAVPQDFITKIVGGQLVRVRSQTVYYILTRMKAAAKVWMNRERASATPS